MSVNFREMANFIWSVADLLRGDYKQSDYGKVILPFTVLRRLDCVLAPTKEAVLKRLEELRAKNIQHVAPVLQREAGQKFYNISRYDFASLLADPNNIAANLTNYIQGFSDDARDIMDYFSFSDQIRRLDEANLLYQVVEKFAAIDLHPERIDNMTMGYIFEELIRRFAEQSNETAGEHFTPREVIKLMVYLLYNEDENVDLRKKGIIRTLYDPACGTGGMLSVAEEVLHSLNPDAQLKVFGQELNPESY